MKFLCTISLLLLVGSCTTQKKAEKYFAKHPEKLAEKCANTFPVKDSIVVKDSISFDTLYLQQEPTILKDSFYLKGDTIIRVVTKECPPAVSLIKTVRHDSIIYRRDMARETVLQYQLQDRQKLISDYLQTIQDQNKELRKDQETITAKTKCIIWLIIIITLQSIYIFRKPLLKLIA